MNARNPHICSRASSTEDRNKERSRGQGRDSNKVFQFSKEGDTNGDSSTSGSPENCGCRFFVFF